MSLFNTTWRTHITNLLPSFKRSTSVIDFLSSLLEALPTKSVEWTAFDAEVKKRSRFNAQAIVLRAALNNIFGITSAPFILVQNNGVINTVVYNETESFPPGYVYNSSESLPKYVYNASEIAGRPDFTILIPASIHTTDLERQVTAETNTYKLAGKTFDVTTYT